MSSYIQFNVLSFTVWPLETLNYCPFPKVYLCAQIQFLPPFTCFLASFNFSFLGTFVSCSLHLLLIHSPYILQGPSSRAGHLPCLSVPQLKAGPPAPRLGHSSHFLFSCPTAFSHQNNLHFLDRYFTLNISVSFCYLHFSLDLLAISLCLTILVVFESEANLEASESNSFPVS